jgi:hypothetical protein
MLGRRLLALGPIAGAIALAAPAAAGASVTPLTFPAGTVTVEDPSPASVDEVRFTMPDGPGVRAFVDVRGNGESHIAMGSVTALGVEHAVYTSQSFGDCQVYTGTTFGEADKQPNPPAGTLVFDIRKDELARDITVVLDDSAGTGPNCTGFDGSPGRLVVIGTTPNVLGLTWQQPGDATNLRAIPGPGAITLTWTPPADAVGVRYVVSELRPDGSFAPFDEAVGSSFTITGLTPGVPHTYAIRPYRYWAGPWPSPNPTAPVTAAASAPAVAPAPVASAPAVTSPAPAAAKKQAATASAKRPAAPRVWKAKASHGRVLITLPKLAKGQRFEVLRATKAKYGRIARTTHSSYTDRTVKRGATYRYRLVLVGANGLRSLPSKTIAVRVPR